ncbi:hypothetical protein GDO86_000815 [Hymenochirus boettgeri]|uniref:Uncharacterized protein n=1 Tax=Hymenochirus boettgeri TaxID=247094 RepID=A0A8T2KIC2_9PIPI|nr:hypothetical protein GDO86_000815 [Hymenochirus boettgeri]
MPPMLHSSSLSVGMSAWVSGCSALPSVFQKLEAFVEVRSSGLSLSAGSSRCPWDLVRIALRRLSLSSGCVTTSWFASTWPLTSGQR